MNPRGAGPLWLRSFRNQSHPVLSRRDRVRYADVGLNGRRDLFEHARARRHGRRSDVARVGRHLGAQVLVGKLGMLAEDRVPEHVAVIMERQRDRREEPDAIAVQPPPAKRAENPPAPRMDEDLEGEPFVGRAGQLLNDILTKGMGLRREDVYIANVIKCRPPDNRNPEPDEVAACEPFLKKQIDLIRPDIIVALGKFAVQTLLQSKVSITKLRGEWHTYHGIKLMPTFHPAYLLRNPADKKLVWEDIKKVMREMRGENA